MTWNEREDNLIANANALAINTGLMRRNMEDKKEIVAELEKPKPNHPGMANLNPPVKKGEVLNPKGRPKGSKNLKTIYKRCVEYMEEQGKIPKSMTKEDSYHPIMGILAIAHDERSSNEVKLKAFTQLLEHTEGKAVQRVEVKEAQEVIMVQPEDQKL